MFDPDNINLDYVSFFWTVYHCRQDPSAEDYLSFARKDLADGTSPRYLINALSNAKRALHMRMEDVCLGFGAVSLKNLKNFHALSNYLKNCGLPSLAVLEKLNKARNDIEHDFSIPEQDMVETYIDVAHLFLSATDRWSGRHPCDIEIDETNEAGDRYLRHINFNWKTGSVILRISGKGSKHLDLPHSITYTNKESEFFKWVTFATKNST
ncbi:hypothetical protein [Pseudomonas kitaguniensis]|uniref:hypothetical protein n=1 Tax=Pseudomonas kitaguniensis TaxID=2607908 RepID=UPI003B9F8067